MRANGVDNLIGSRRDCSVYPIYFCEQWVRVEAVCAESRVVSTHSPPMMDCLNGRAPRLQHARISRFVIINWPLSKNKIRTGGAAKKMKHKGIDRGARYAMELWCLGLLTWDDAAPRHYDFNDVLLIIR
jgi:hypothetical protein